MGPFGLRAFVVFFTVFLTVGLAACGGSGKSSSGSSSDATFRGSETLRFLNADRPNAPVLSQTFPLRIDLRGRAVRIVNVDGDEFAGNLSGTNFRASGVIELGNLGSGITCSNANVTYDGRVAGNSMTGTVQSQTNCQGFGQRVRMRIEGRFAVSRHARQAVGRGDLKSAIRTVLEGSF